MTGRPNRRFTALGTPVVPDYSSQVERLASNDRSLVLAIHASVKNAGRGRLTSSIGVFFGRSSPHNISARIPKGEGETCQAAEIYAAAMALETVQGSELATNLNLLIVAVHSKYTPQVMNQAIWDWERNDYKFMRKPSTRGHQDIVQDLQQVCTQLEKEGIEVKFWHCTKGESNGAKSLALDALRNSMSNLNR